MLSDWPIIAIGVGVLLVLLLIIAFYSSNLMKKEKKKHPDKFPEGHFMGLGIATFMPIGIAIGLALDNIALGIPIGLAIGVAIGSAWENKAKKEGKLRPLTKKEKELKRKSALLGFLIAILIFITFAVIFLMTP